MPCSKQSGCASGKAARELLPVSGALLVCLRPRLRLEPDKALSLRLLEPQDRACLLLARPCMPWGGCAAHGGDAVCVQKQRPLARAERKTGRRLLLSVVEIPDDH